MADVLANFVFDQPAQDSGLSSSIIRQLFNTLGRCNWTTDANYPQNPREGMLRTLASDPLNIRLQQYRSGAWRTLVSHLNLNPTIARRLEFNFAAAATWTIDHGLGDRPLVQCFDTATNNLVIPTSIQHVLVAGQWDRTIVTHGAPLAGYAILIG